MPLSEKLGPILLMIGAIIYLNCCVGCCSKAYLEKQNKKSYDEGFSEGYRTCLKSHWNDRTR